MEYSQRFFVSFSSEDLKYVREIMTALKGQELNVWDYSDIMESIELGEIIFDRLTSEIDQCTHMVVVISANSLHPVMGRFCRMEIEHAIRQRSNRNLTLFPVIVGERKELKLDGYFKEFEQALSYDFELTPESIVDFTVKVCKAIGKGYIPPIDAHPKLPFRDLFRKEIAEMDIIAKMTDKEKRAHKNKNHTDLMTILGEFNEYYRSGGEKNIQSALFLITYFLMSWEYEKVRYKPFYPLIVKAVCETELEMYEEAIKSFEKAKTIRPENQDVIGGIGTVYFLTRQYRKAADCFEQIIRNNTFEDISNARINLIITKQSMEVLISAEEERFL